MNAIQTEHIAIQLQALVVLTIAQGIGQDLPAAVAIEQVVPVMYGEGDVVGAGVRVDRYTTGGHGG